MKKKTQTSAFARPLAKKALNDLAEAITLIRGAAMQPTESAGAYSLGR